MNKTRRTFLGAALAGTATLAASPFIMRQAISEETPSRGFEVSKSEAEWKKILTPMEYKVLREEGTERAFTSPLNDEKRDGVFHCKGCDLALYDAATKYDSGTGWPSFYQALDNAVGTKEDRSFFMTRTEVHCRRCGGHLGHVFDDGPAPTGKRHCINGVSLSFKAA